MGPRTKKLRGIDTAVVVMSRNVSLMSQNSLHHGSSVVSSRSYTSTAMATNEIKLLTGNSHPSLAKAVADRSVEMSNFVVSDL